MLLADSVKTMLSSDIISVFMIITCTSILSICVCSCWHMEYQLNFERKTLEVPRVTALHVEYFSRDFKDRKSVV